MNTRSTRRTTATTRAKPKPVAAPKTKITVPRTRRQQQKVAETQQKTLEEEEKVIETNVEEVVEQENGEKHDFTEEEGIQQAEEVVEDHTHHDVIEGEVHHQQVVVEEEYSQQQELMEDVEQHQIIEENSHQQQVFEVPQHHQEVIEVIHNSEHIVVMDQSSEQLTAHEMESDLTDCWTEEKNQIDGKLEFVCKWLLCSFRTQSECSIRKHAIKHQKPYQCSFVGCGQRFGETQDLLEHFGATHMDTNAFKCTFADCDQRFRDIKSLTEHRVSHVSHTTQLIKANKDYKPGNRTSTTAQAIDLQQIFGQNFENTTTIELTGNLVSDQQFIVVTDGVVSADGQTHNIVVTTEATDDRYRNKQRMTSVIRCPINALTDDIVEGNDNYVKCRTNDGKFWYKCLWDYCDYGNINEGIIRRHVLKHEFPHKCSFEACNKSFTTLSEMAEHRQMTHSGPNPYVCDWPECSDAFPGMKDLTEHKRNHLIEANALSSSGSGSRQKKAKQPVPLKPFMCNFGKCNMHYATEEELEIHKQIHSGDRPYKCQYSDCTFAAKSKDKLHIHHSRHSMDKMYRCLWPTCDKSFTIAEQLRRHRKLHTHRDQLICEFTGCDLIFQTAVELERHLRRHIGLDDSVVESLNPMPYKCNFGLCKMHFATDDELQKHSQSHRGDRFYKCNFDKCSYSAKTLDKLNAHIRYHSGERPFKCDFIGCHQDFIQSHHLARHRKTHFGAEESNPPLNNTDIRDELEDQLQCQYCELSFEEESGLEQHMTDEHSVQIVITESEVSHTTPVKRKRLSGSQSKTDDLPENNINSEDGPPEKQSKTTRRTKKSENSGQPSEPTKSIVCTFGKCNFRCATDEELTEHLDKLHSGDRPFACEFESCTFRTNRKDKLTLHIRRHTGEKPFKCDWNECDKSFISKEQLNRHNLTHFKSKQTLSKMELIDKDFDKTLQELEELLQENDGNEKE